MWKIPRTFNQLRRKISIIMLAGLVWIISLPITSVQAAGYYSEKDHKIEINRPYYGTKERRIAQKGESFQPYYASKERQNVRANIPTTGDDYIESGKRAAEVIPKELGSGSRQKNPLNMLKRAGEEITNEPYKRTFGAKDYERSEIEQELARNKAARGDFD